MLRCRRCRKTAIDSSHLATDAAADEGSCAVCSIWHVNTDSLPEWILTSVHQSHWTVGKLNCQNCGARLGGFNFINHTKCPCGLDATVHLSKSRVDRDHKHCVLIVQPRRTRPEKRRAQMEEEREALSRTERGALQAQPGPAGATGSESSSSSSALFPFSPLYCISHRRRCSLEDDASYTTTCFCPSALTERSPAALTRTDSEATWPPLLYTGQELGRDGEASLAFHSSARRRRLRDQELLEIDGDRDEATQSSLFLRGRTDSVEEQEEEGEARVSSSSSPASNSLKKRERNKLKSLRRKQRRRERRLLSEQEQAERARASKLLLEEVDREGLSCAVCLDVYFSPHSCQPCAHVFCEPCLRMIAKNQPKNTPCPLCRTPISNTDPHKELDQTAKTLFPKLYLSRQQTFQKAMCAKWPLPSCRKGFRTFWGYQRHAAAAAAAEGRWQFGRGPFMLEAFDLNDMRRWLFDIGLVIVYIHSVNWILAVLLMCFLMYYLLF